MTTVDERVVELGFNNKEFEQGVKTSTKSLENLKKGLDFDETTKSMSNLSAAGKKFSLAGMAEGVQGISNRFSTMGIVGMTIIQNLTNAAIQYGKKMVSQLMDPMKQGFAEYETQMNAIQTVLANTAAAGTTLEDVSAALDELNTYADKTIYNFTEMTRNIGTFTAAGVDLDTSTQAIKGIANLAAVSGSNSQQASTAMYQLSQALSSGTVKLMDWNSVVNAGMGGKVFQDALTETARVSGIAIDDLIDKHGSFRETLSTGWLSSEVLLDTLAKFTGDLSEAQLKTLGYNEEQIESIIKLGETANDAATKVKTFSQLQETLQEALGSGWTKTWEIIIGDFEEAKEFYTEISDILGGFIGASSDARNSVLQDWKDIGGRTFLIVAIRNAFEGLLSIMRPIGEAFREIFPPITGLQLASLTANLATLTEKLTLTSENADRVKRIFKGIFSVFSIVKDVVFEVVGVFLDLAGAIPVSGDGILEFLARIGDFLVGLREGTNVTAIFQTAIERLQEIFASVLSYVDLAKEALISWKEAVVNTFRGLFDSIDTTALQDFFGKFEGRFRPFEAMLKVLGLIIGGILKGATKLIPGLFKVAGAIADFVGKLGSMIVDALSNINFVEVFDVINTGLIAAILLAIRNFISSGSGVLDEVGGVFEGVVDVLDGVRGSLQAWQQNLKSKTLLTIAFAVGILAAALIALSMIDSAKLTVAIGILTGMFVQLIAAQAAFSKIGGLGGVGALGLMGMATAMLIMASAISVLAKIDQSKMQNALGIIYALMTGMLILSRFMGKNGPAMISGSIGMVAVAVAMLVLVTVLRKLGEMDVSTLQQGLIGVGLLLAEIAAFMRLVDDKGVSKGLGLLAMAGAVLVLAQVVKQLGTIDPAVLQQGLIGIAAVLAAVAAFSRVSGGGKGMIATALGVTILSAAMLILADVIGELGKMDPTELAIGLAGMAGALLIIAAAVKALPKSMVVQAIGLLIVAAAISILAESLEDMGGMSWEEIGKGLATLAGAMLILSVGLYAMTGTIAGSAALLIAAGALAVLTPVLTTLGQMPLTEIGIALLALAGVFVVLGVAGLVLTPIVPTLLGLGVAMLLIGAGAALVGLGLLAFATGLMALAAGGAVAAVAIVAFVTTLLSLLPIVINTLIDTLIVFAKGIQRAAPEVAAAITAMMLAFLQVIIDTAPTIFETLDTLIKGLIQLIVDNIPEFVAAVVLLLLTLLQEIAAKMPEFLQAGFDILIEFLKGIRDNIAEVVTVVSEIVVEFLGAVADNLPDIIQAGVDLIIAFIDGMALAVDENMEPLLTSIAGLAGSIIQGLIDGLAKGAKYVISAIVDLVEDAIAAAWKAFGSTSPSKEMIVLAKTVPEGIVVGLKKYGYRAVRAMKDMGEDVVDSVGFVSKAARDLLDGDLNIDPTIRPVVDMSAIEEANRDIDDIFSTRTLDMAPAMVSSSRISAGLQQTTSQPSTNVVNEGAKIEYVQNNYSPEALSRLEIYRQTKNQLLTLKGVGQS